MCALCVLCDFVSQIGEKGGSVHLLLSLSFALFFELHLTWSDCKYDF